MNISPATITEYACYLFCATLTAQSRTLERIFAVLKLTQKSGLDLDSKVASKFV